MRSGSPGCSTPGPSDGTVLGSTNPGRAWDRDCVAPVLESVTSVDGLLLLPFHQPSILSKTLTMILLCEHPPLLLGRTVPVALFFCA